MKPTKTEIKGYTSVKLPAYKPAIDDTEGTRTAAKLPSFATKFQSFKRDDC